MKAIGIIGIFYTEKLYRFAVKELLCMNFPVADDGVEVFGLVLKLGIIHGFFGNQAVGFYGFAVSRFDRKRVFGLVAADENNQT